MYDEDDQFTPDKIDEQITYFSSKTHSGATSQEQLLADLYQVYSEQKFEEVHKLSLQRSWARIVAEQSSSLSDAEIYPSQHQARVLVFPTSRQANKISPFPFMKNLLQNFIIDAAALLVISSMIIFTIVTNNIGSPPSADTIPPSTQAYTAVARFQQEGRSLSGIDWSFNGQHIASTSQSVFSWDAMTGKNSVHYTSGMNSTPPARWSPDGKYIAVPLHSEVQIWKSNTQTVSTTLQYPFKGTHSQDIRVVSVHWSEDSTSLEALFNLIGLDGTSMNLIVSINRITHNITVKTKLDFKETITCVSWSPDGAFIAIASSEKPVVRIVELQTGRIVNAFSTEEPIIYFAWSSDGTSIVSGSKVTMHIRKVATGKIIETQNGFHLYSWSPDGWYAAFVSFHSSMTFIYIKEMETGKIITLGKYQGRIDALAWSPNGKYIALGGLPNSDNNLCEVLVWKLSFAK